MAIIHRIGTPENDSEARAIKRFAKDLPDDCFVFHNFEVTTGRGLPYEYDIAVLTPHALYHVEVKGYHGEIRGNPMQWFFENGSAYPSPIPLANKKTKILAGKLRQFSPRLESVFVETLILLTEDRARAKLNDDQAGRVVHLHEAIDRGFTILQDSGILDLRPWKPSDSAAPVYGSRRLSVLKDPENTGNGMFRVAALTTHPEAKFRFPSSQYQPKLRRTRGDNSNGEEATCEYEVSVDLAKAPAGQLVDVVYEHYGPAVFVQCDENATTVAFRAEGDALELTRWILLPAGEEYRSYQIVRYETGKPETAEVVQGLTEDMVDDPGIIAFKLALVKAGQTFEVTWSPK